MIEGTLAAIDPPARSLRVGRFHLEGTLAAYLHLGFDLGLASASAHHESVYVRMGFRNVSGRPAFSHVVGPDAVALAVRPADLRPDVRARVERYAEELNRHGACTLEHPAALEMAA